jgi:hypothetical protein
MNNPFQSYNRGYTARERRIRRDLGVLLVITGIICVWLAVRVTRTDKELEKTEAINTVLQHQTVNLMNQVDSLKAECSDKDSLLTKRGITALINQRDSLRDELFNANTQIGRYEIGIEIFKERNPSGARQLDRIIGHETE